MEKNQEILLFSGQGSRSYMDDAPPVDIQTSPAAEFLQHCLEAFHAEADVLSDEERQEAGLDARNTFKEPASLLSLPPELRTSVVLESVNFYIHQVLDLVRYRALEGRGVPVSLAGGVCSGMLPAVLAATLSSNTPQFLDYATQGFRLAFWIGVRNAQFCQANSSEPSRPWMLTVNGLLSEEVSQRVDEYNEKTKPKLPLRIASVLTADVISVCGNPRDLEGFKTTLPRSIPARYAHIHGYYHGGASTKTLIDEIVSDVSKRSIHFPTWDQLNAPLLSMVDGTVLDSTIPLLETTLQHMLMEPIDCTKAHHYVCSRPEKAPVVLVGPNVASLRLEFRSEGSRRLSLATPQSIATEQQNKDSIAIVGMSTHFPSGNGVDQFWETLESERSTLSEIPKSRFDVNQYYQDPKDGKKPKTTARSMGVRYGNFVDDPFTFDNTFFNISPREAKSIDPQQRMLLQCSLGALEDAGYAPDSSPTFQKDTFGVYVGIATGDYVDNLRQTPDVYYSPGTLRAFLSGRISYAFEFHGPSLVIDTACSSSVVAIHQACNALRAGQCTAALAGAANVVSSPDMYIGLARAHFLSQTGQCKPWDKDADGYSRAEGSGVVVLKKLSDALAEGDRIHGVIRGTEVNQCGTSKSITHPDHQTQADLMNQLLYSTGVDSDSITVVEAHGTGTQAGDYAESKSLGAVLGSRAADNPFYVSSVKGNIGHAEAASGMAGLTKLLLMMKHGKIPPQASLKNLNPRLNFTPENNVIIPRQLEDWPSHGPSPRRALLNNFGAAGSNAALILEEAPMIAPPTRRNAAAESPSRSCHILNISAKTKSALDNLRKQFAILLETKGNSIGVDKLCSAANGRREAYPQFRLSVTGATSDDLAKKLSQSQIIDAQAPEEQKQQGENKNVFVFSGQGGIHLGMGRELVETSPRFYEEVAKLDRTLSSHGFKETMPYIRGDSEYNDTLDDNQRIVWEQCACFVLEYALAQTWIDWGVKPRVVTGHSLGEYAAFATSGMLSPTDAVLLVARRATLMASLCEKETTGMVACRFSISQAHDLISQNETSLAGISVSCENGPEDTVLNGPLPVLDRLVEIVKKSQLKCTPLRVPFGYHSPAMDPMLEDFRQLLLDGNISFNPPSIPLCSSYLGTLITPSSDPLPPITYFADQARSPVKFTSVTKTLSDHLNRSAVFLEMGPSPATVPKVKWAFDVSQSVIQACLTPKESAWTTTCGVLQTLFLRRQQINWRNVYETTGSTAEAIHHLPRYPLDTSKSFVVPFEEPTAQQPDSKQDAVSAAPKDSSTHELVDTTVTRKEDDGDTVTLLADTSALGPFIRAHQVGGVPLCPASVYLEMVLEGLDAAVIDDSAVKPASFNAVSDVVFEGPLVAGVDDGKSQEVQVTLKNCSTSPSPKAVYPDTTFTISSSGRGKHCAGVVSCSSVMDGMVERKTAFVTRQKQTMAQAPTPPERFSAKTIYDTIFPRVVAYWDPLKTLDHLYISSGSGLEGYGTFRIPEWPSSSRRIVYHPAFVDTLLHAPGFMANASVGPSTVCICSKVDSIVMPMDPAPLAGQDLEVYCDLVDIGHSIIADAVALDSTGKTVAWAEGMAFKKLPLTVFKSHLARIAKEPAGSKETGKATQKSAPMQSPPKSAKKKTPVREVRNGQAEGRSDMLAPLHDLVRQTCGLDPKANLGPTVTLSELGVDSLMLLELGEALTTSDILSGSKGTLDLDSCQTVGDLEVAVEACTGRTMTSSSPPQQQQQQQQEAYYYDTDSVSTSSANDSTPQETSDSAVTTPPNGMTTTTTEQLADILNRVIGLDIATVDKTSTLGSLGVDSLGSMELMEELREQLGVTDIGGNDDHDEDAISNLTVQGLEEAIVSQTKSTPPHLPVEADLLQQGKKPTTTSKNNDDDDTRLILFHDGSGKGTMYNRLSLPSIGQPPNNVTGLSSPDSSSPTADPTLKTLQDMARAHVIRSGLDQPSSSSQPLILGGWSFGGVLAYEVARQLSSSSSSSPEIKGVILIDSPFPINHVGLPGRVIDSIVQDLPVSKEEIKERLKGQFRRHAGMLEGYNPEKEKDGDGKIPVVMIQCTKAFETKGILKGGEGEEYSWLSELEKRKGEVGEWERLTGMEVPVLELGCHHFEVFDDKNIAETSRLIDRACEMLRKDGSSKLDM